MLLICLTQTAEASYCISLKTFFGRTVDYVPITYGSALEMDLLMSTINRRNADSKQSLFKSSYGHLTVVFSQT